MAFHCGVLQWLAERGRLGDISHISSVSGGSLFTGLVFQFGNWEWPSDEVYCTDIKPKIRALLIQASLEKAWLWKLLRPRNWRYFLSRANVLSETIAHHWGIVAKLRHLPEKPVWSVNGTTAENGRRFRFKQTSCGDYEIGYADAEGFKASDALAVSAAFPGLIGPFVIRTADFTWQRRKAWDDPPESAVNVTPPFPRLHLYDGGIYDNLGMEPLFETGPQRFKDGINSLIVSDAGAPLTRSPLGRALNPFRFKRIADITLDQTRALRIRVWINFLQSHPERGMYLQLGAHAPDRIEQYAENNPEGATALLTESWLDREEVERASAEPTSLGRLTPDAFDRLARHGYETARWNEILFMRPTAAAGESGKKEKDCKATETPGLSCPLSWSGREE